MLFFLEKVQNKALREYILSSTPYLSSNEIENLSRESLIGIISSLFGYDLLFEKKARRMLLLTLEPEILRSLATTLKVKRQGSHFDIAMSIATIPWRVGSNVVKKFSACFQIPDDYLPTRNIGNLTIDTVEPFTPLPELFDYQQEMVEKLNYFFDVQDLAAAIVQLPTGAGKTSTMMTSIVEFANAKSICDKDVTVLWLAHTEELCEQAIESFRRTWQSLGVSDKKIIRFWGSYNVKAEEMSRAFVVAGYQKIANLYKNKPDDFKTLSQQLDLIVIDEAHKALAPSIKVILENIKTECPAKVLGLTATPGRGVVDDEENTLLANLFDRNLLTVKSLGDNPIDTLQKRGILAKVNREMLRVKNRFNLGNKEINNIYEMGDFSTNILKRLAEDNRRNDLIVSKVFEHVGQGNQTLVFACSVEHSKKLSLSVSMKKGRSASVDCTMRRNQRRKVINEFKNGSINVLFNYGVLSTGFDAPNIKTIIIARPTTSIILYSQMIGRGLRGEMMGGSEECCLVDVIDNFINFGKADEVYDYFVDFWK